MTEKQTERRAQIEMAAFAVLEEVGYKKASMLQIAKRAKASNETLYAWYGNKQALFSSLIKDNAGRVEKILEAAISNDCDQSCSLVEIGKLLLHFTATEKAVIINRAAVSDVQETGLLAGAIEENARSVMFRLLRDFMRKLERAGHYHFDDGTEVATRVYIDLLIGELQMQQSLQAIPPLTTVEIEHRTEQARTLFDRLYRQK
jgi:AcrR family transcriptional regulator